MSNLLILYRPREEVKRFAEEANERFDKMFSTPLQVYVARSINEIAHQIELKLARIVFIEAYISLADSNSLRAAFERQKVKPYIIAHQDNYEALSRSIPKERLGRSATKLNPNFIFQCLRNLLAPTGRKMDERYLRGILKSVIGVVDSNANIKLLPKKISEIQPAPSAEVIVSAFGFYGDGFLGSITLKSNKALLERMAQTILFLEESEITPEIISDLADELGNQVEGAIRVQLQSAGYILKNSLQLTLTGESEFHHKISSGGQYYAVPFALDDMKLDVLLSYNTYKTSVFDLEDEEIKNNKKRFDVRLINAANTSFSKHFAEWEPLKQSAQEIPHDGLAGSSLHLFQVADWKGKVTIGLLLTKDVEMALMSELTGLEPQYATSALINESLNSLTDAILLEFLEITKTFQYSFQKVYKGSFSGEKFTFKIVNAGYFFRETFATSLGLVELIIGCDSHHASDYYDAWPSVLSLISEDQV